MFKTLKNKKIIKQREICIKHIQRFFLLRNYALARIE